MGAIYHNTLGNNTKAMEYYERGLKIMEVSLPANHPTIAASLNNIGNVYSDLGANTKAMEYYEKGLKIMEASLPANHPNIILLLKNISKIYHYLGDKEKATKYLTKSNLITTSKPEAIPNPPAKQEVPSSAAASIDKAADKAGDALAIDTNAAELSQQRSPEDPMHMSTMGDVSHSYDDRAE